MQSIGQWAQTLVTNHIHLFDYLRHVHMKTIRPWLLKIYDFSLVDSVTCPALGLHEGSYGSQPITSSVDEKST